MPMQPTAVRSLQRATGTLFLVSAVTFAVAATVLSSAFEWPDILREPAHVVLPAFAAQGESLIWIWFATAWTYALLAVPVMLLPAALQLRDDPWLRVLTGIGAVSILLSLIGFLRWVFVVPQLAAAYVEGDAAERTALDAAWVAQHQYGGALLGEHLGQLLIVCWSVGVCIVVLRTRVLPRWVARSGLTVSTVYLLNQGDILATALPDFPVWDLAGLLGSTGWGLWVMALGISLLRKTSSSSQTPATSPQTHVPAQSVGGQRHAATSR